MCGIAGALALAAGGTAITEQHVSRMRDAMAHRGPDGAGTWISPDGRVGLGHRRLSIIDLSVAASQPMGNEDGALQVVFNGEIYNHQLLRKELETKGQAPTWRGHSDTETVLACFETWGVPDTVQKLVGMFAMGL